MGKVYIEGHHGDYGKMWRKWGWQIVANILQADIIQFTGGSDVNPEFYGEPQHHFAQVDTDRDERCRILFNQAKRVGIPMTGICRGGQFLNVMNGGKMFQHCDGHGIYGTHKATILATGSVVDVTSTHHQIMRPNRDTGIILMEANPKLGTFKEYMGNYPLFDNVPGKYFVTNAQEEDDVEAVFYPDTMSLCFQPHPEYCDVSSNCQTVYRNFLRNYLDLDI
jgi:gamma-glutamyl-gamma-aminobutyrate hydrolase PuuD